MKVDTIIGDSSNCDTCFIRTSHQLAPSASQSKVPRSASGSAGVNRSPEPTKIVAELAIRHAAATCSVYMPTVRPSTSRRSPNSRERRSLSREIRQKRRPTRGARTRSTISFRNPPYVQGDDFLIVALFAAGINRLPPGGLRCGRLRTRFRVVSSHGCQCCLRVSDRRVCSCSCPLDHLRG